MREIGTQTPPQSPDLRVTFQQRVDLKKVGQSPIQRAAKEAIRTPLSKVTVLDAAQLAKIRQDVRRIMLTHQGPLSQGRWEGVHSDHQTHDRLVGAFTPGVKPAQNRPIVHAGRRVRIGPEALTPQLDCHRPHRNLKDVDSLADLVRNFALRDALEQGEPTG